MKIYNRELSHTKGIVIIGNSLENFQRLIDILQKHDYKVSTAYSMPLDLKAVTNKFPDLILLDMHMPDMSGIEICCQLKSDERTCSIPVIFIGILEDEHARVKGFQVGAADYLARPFQTEEVLTKVRTQLHLRELEEQLEQKVVERTKDLTMAKDSLQVKLSDHKKVEKTLQENQARLIEAQQISHIGNWWHDLITGDMFWSDELFRIVGLEKQQVTPELVNTCIHPDDAPILFKTMEESAADKKEHEHEFRIIRPNGNIRWIHSRWITVNDNKGKEIKRVGTFQDITCRRQAQGKLTEERTMLRCLLDSVSDLIFIKDKTGAYQGCNKEYETFVGISESKMIGKTDFDLFDREQAEELSKTDKQPLDEGKHVRIEEWVTYRDGRHLLMDTIKAPVYSRDGKAKGIVGIGRDITKRILTEKERQANLKFFESMNQINLAIQESNNLEQMMIDVLDAMLSIFNCDRAYLLYPLAPNAETWTMPMIRCRAEYPAPYSNEAVPTDPLAKKVMRAMLDTDDPVKAGMGTKFPLPKSIAERFGFKAFMGTALYPKVDAPWLFAIHQASYDRVWNLEEERLFKEIGRRMGDGLNSLLMYRNLQESEERYRLVFENSPVPVWEGDFSRVKDFFDELKKAGVTDIKTYFDQHPEAIRQCMELAKIVDVNQAALTLHAAANKEELVANLEKLDTPEWFDILRRELVGLWNGYTEMVADTIIKTLAGALHNVTIYFSVCPGHEERFSKVLISIVDITERKRAEEELFKYHHHLEELVKERTKELEIARNKAQQYLDIAGIIMVAIDSDQRVTLINQKGCEILQGSQGEIIGKDWFQTFIPENMRQDVAKRFGQQMKGEFQLEEYTEMPILTKGGQERLVAWHHALLRDEKGRITGTLSSGADITEQKRAEEQIKSLNQDLEDRAASLSEANKELEAFAYSVSHDLRAPLRHIDGFLNLLRKRSKMVLDQQSQEYIDIVLNSSKKMGQLIDDLLSFSRMGRNALSLQQFDIGILVHEVIQGLEPDIAGRNIEWFITDLTTVHGDVAMLRIVLENLISNAVKFTQSREQAEIEIGLLSDQNPETVMYIRDNGVGFDMAYAEKVFSVFHRLHRSDEFEGTGIGLAIVRRIITRHGGQIWAEGRPDQGATFFFSLPQKR
jgi:PAS domain S-box-containing protein